MTAAAAAHAAALFYILQQAGDHMSRPVSTLANFATKDHMSRPAVNSICETGEIVPRLRSPGAATALTWYRDCGHLVQRLQSPLRTRLPVVILAPGTGMP